MLAPAAPPGLDWWSFSQGEAAVTCTIPYLPAPRQSHTAADHTKGYIKALQIHCRFFQAVFLQGLLSVPHD